MKITFSKHLVALAGFLLSIQTRANIIISLEPTPQTIVVGSPVSMDLVISGIGDHSSASLVGGFDFDLSYDSAILSAASISFGSHLDLGVFGSIQFSDISTLGAIHVDEVSFETVSGLNSNQPSSFKLATIILNGVGAGSSSVTFANGSLSDENGASLDFQTLAAEIDVSRQTTVPDAGSTLLLAGIGFAGIWGLRRAKVGSHSL